MIDEKTCLSCTLPICDETLPECAYVQITRANRPKSKLPEMQKIYNHRSYEKHADKRRDEKRTYYAENTEAAKESQSRYRAKTDRREYFRERYARSKAAI